MHRTKKRADPKSISYSTLLKRLADPDCPREQIIPYLTVDEAKRMGTAPILKPNEYVHFTDLESVHDLARGDVGLGFLNSVYRSRRRRRFERRLRRGDSRPVLLAEGDSWFQYPAFLEDTIDHLQADYNILCLSAAGDELRTIATNAEYWDHLKHLRERGVTIRAFLLSAGGNDIVGDELADILVDFTPGSTADQLLNENAVASKFSQIETGYRTIIEKVRSQFPNLPIIFHGYDYAIPRPDQGFHIPPLDGWLGDPMRKRNIPDGPIQAEIVRLLIDQINTTLSGFDEGEPNGMAGVHYIDNRNVISKPKQWHDELHPTDDGFKLIAKKFKGELTQLGL
jgi:hypothetical protein